MKINILTIGTRGDVQPYLGLGTRLAARGHAVAVQTLAEFKDAVEDTGLEHRRLRGTFSPWHRSGVLRLRPRSR